LGWGSIIYLAALSGIPAEQYEAATVDGANSRQRLLYITLPGMAPTIGLMFIFTVGGLLKDSFDAVYNLRNALVSSTANTIEYYVLAKGVLGGKLSLAAAIGLAQSVFSLALVVSANAVSRKIRGYGAF
jgi:putative aldouronate transport system permease protein